MPLTTSSGDCGSETEADMFRRYLRQRIRRIWRTEPVDPQRVKDSIAALYISAGLPVPPITLVPSPRARAAADGMAVASSLLARYGPELAPAQIHEDQTLNAVLRVAVAPFVEDNWRTNQFKGALTDKQFNRVLPGVPAKAWRNGFHSPVLATALDKAIAAPLDLSLELTDILENRFKEHQWLAWHCMANWSHFVENDISLVLLGWLLGAPKRKHDLPLENLRSLQALEEVAAQCGPCFLHREFCIVSDFPEQVSRDRKGRPHCEDGPSLRWRDGWSLYHWHGVPVPRDVIERPEAITIARIDNEPEDGIQDAMLERIGGLGRYLHYANAEVAHTLPDDYPVPRLRGARLYRHHRAGRRRVGNIVVIIALSNRRRSPGGRVVPRYIRVDPLAYNGDAGRHCHAAFASTFCNRDGSLTFRHWQDCAPGAES